VARGGIHHLTCSRLWGPRMAWVSAGPTRGRSCGARRGQGFRRAAWPGFRGEAPRGQLRRGLITADAQSALGFPDLHKGLHHQMPRLVEAVSWHAFERCLGGDSLGTCGEVARCRAQLREQGGALGSGEVPGPSPARVIEDTERVQEFGKLSRDLRLGLWDKFPPPPDPALEAAFAQFVRDHAAAHGWPKGYTATIQRGIRIMLGIQDTPSAPIRHSDVLLLTRIKHSAATVTDVIAAAGMLEDDIEPLVVRWFHAKTAALPEPMHRELGVWLEVMRNGSTIPPRSKPRADDTIRAQFAFALPVLQSWAVDRDSLREITRADVLAALPPSGQPRATTVQGLRSIFRILRSRKLVFTNPTLRIHVPALPMTVPPAVDLAALRDALDSPSPARAVVTALLAYHAIPMRQLAQLQLTDIRGGRLHLDDRVILLAEPVRDRVDAYLSYRTATWPATINAYLFIHARRWKSTRPVTSAWIGQQLAIPAEHIRLDRIYQEVEATGGDIRALCDLFGMSIANAARWATIIDHITETASDNHADSARGR